MHRPPNDLLHWLCRAVSPLTPAGALAPLPGGRWRDALTLADRHLLLPELYRATQRHAATIAVLSDIAGMLEAFFVLNAERNGELRAQMRQLSQAFGAAGIRHVWLKGATVLIGDDWAGSGRMMNDLDFWIPDQDRQTDALSILADLGYQTIPGEEEETWRASHHFAARYTDAWPVRVEPHRHVIDQACADLLPDAAVLAAVAWIDWGGCTIGIPAAEHRLLHAAVQATAMAIPVFGTARTPLMKALDIVQIGAAHGWETLPPDVATTLAQPHWLPWSRPLLTLTERLFGLPNPVGTAAGHYRRLRTVTRWPRLGLAVETMARIVDGRLFRRLARPATLPEVVGRYVRIFRTGRDFR